LLLVVAVVAMAMLLVAAVALVEWEKEHLQLQKVLAIQ
jgi:hypothetical protein